MIDLLRTIGGLVKADGTVQIDHFYDKVAAVTEEEECRYKELQAALQVSPRFSRRTESDVATSLKMRWRLPSISLHAMTVSGSGLNTIIPGRCEVSLSCRIVPNQEVEETIDQLRRHLLAKFHSETSSNQIHVFCYRCRAPHLGIDGHRVR